MAFPNEKQKIYMVSGKGGVGKSIVAAALAQREAHSGLKTLLVELGDQSHYTHVYQLPINYGPTEVLPRLSVSLWRGEDCLREYILHLVKIEKIVQLFFDNRVMRAFVRAAPALKELAILGKVTSGIRSWGPPLKYDVIVVDAFATGHFMALVKAPIGMAELIEGGPMGEQSRQIHKVLRRPDLCEYWVVTLPEELPVSEAAELAQDIQKTLGQKAKILCNRYYDPQLDESEMTALSSANATLNSFATYLAELLQRQKNQMVNLIRLVGRVKTLPMVLSSDTRLVINTIEAKLND